jgi:hypothetical protein
MNQAQLIQRELSRSASRITSVLDVAGLRRRLRGPLNPADACLLSRRMNMDVLVALGGLKKICCPRGKKQYKNPPWIMMPSEGRRFKPIGILPVPAPPFTGLDTPVLTVRVPLGYDGVITDLVCEILPGPSGSTGFIEGSGDLTWRLSSNGRFLRDEGNILTTLGSLVTPTPVPRGGLRVWSDDLLVFSVAFAVGADARIAADANVVCSITGWWYPR